MNLADEIRKKVEESPLAQFVRWEGSQFLEVPEGLFVEIVLSDAGKIGEMRTLLTRFAKEHGLFDFIVRGDWQLQEVQEPRQSYAESGSPRMALEFPTVLRSGSVVQQVGVVVTYSATKRLEELKVAGFKALKELVKEHVLRQLKLGGTSFWDPLKFPYLEINDAAVSYLVSRGILHAISKQAG